jgi:hypothetical protein
MFLGTLSLALARSRIPIPIVAMHHCMACRRSCISRGGTRESGGILVGETLGASKRVRLLTSR